MSQRMNDHGQPIGEDVAGWKGAVAPTQAPIEGRHCRLEALEVARHADDLFAAYGAGEHPELWTYMPVGPFPTIALLQDWLGAASTSADPLFYAIIDKASGRAIGIASYLRITPQAGTIEVGNIAFSPLLQKTVHATECMYLMMKRAFDELGYRRYEWKCDALNAPSRRAATRFGFSYDGLFRQALVYKGRNRDTAWYSILDQDWASIGAAYEAWLDPSNFDAAGRQKTELASFVSQARAAG